MMKKRKVAEIDGYRINFRVRDAKKNDHTMKRNLQDKEVSTEWRTSLLDLGFKGK